MKKSNGTVKVIISGSLLLVLLVMAVLKTVYSQEANLLTGWMRIPGQPAQSVSSSLKSMMTPTTVIVAIPEAEDLGLQVSSIQELQREYVNYKLSDLEAELKSLGADSRLDTLVDKANQGVINQEETKELILSLRKQGVLNQLIVQHKVQGLKRKYL